MALIKCSECGKEISDKANACVNCGCPIEKELICVECGNKIDKNDKVCKSCGCPIVPNNIKNEKKYNNIGLIVGGIITLVILLFLFEFCNIVHLDIELILYALLGVACLYLSILFFVLWKRKVSKKKLNIFSIISIISFLVFGFCCMVFLVNIDYILDTNDFNNDDNSVIIGEWLGTSTDYFEFFEDSTFEYTCYSNTCPSDFLVQTPIGGNHKTCYTKGTYELKNEKSIYLYPTQSTCEISSDIVIWAFASDYTYFCANNGGICFGGWQKSSDTPYHLNIDGTRIK